jgi:hypothetical protein
MTKVSTTYNEFGNVLTVDECLYCITTGTLSSWGSEEGMDLHGDNPSFKYSTTPTEPEKMKDLFFAFKNQEIKQNKRH